MKAVIGTSAAMLALLLAGCGDDKSANSAQPASSAKVAAAPVAAPNGGDWTQTVTESPEGGYVMGNPNAPVKLVEYASYTCPHCAEFTEEASAPLQDKYVKTGQVSWEFRPFMLFPTDPGIAMLVRCHGAEASFLLTDQLYATQREWTERVRTMSDAEAQQLQNMTPQQRMPALIKATGLDQFFRQRGMPEAKINTCLADQQGLQKTIDITDRGSKEFGVTGTPTFFINGTKFEGGGTWAALEPAIRQALGQ